MVSLFYYFLEGGIAKIQEIDLGISITTKIERGESLLGSSDRVV